MGLGIKYSHFRFPKIFEKKENFPDYSGVLTLGGLFLIATIAHGVASAPIDPPIMITVAQAGNDFAGE